MTDKYLRTEGDIVVKMGEVDFFRTPDADKVMSILMIDFREGSFHSLKS